MRIVKFIKADFILTRPQVKLMGCFLILAVLVSLCVSNPGFGVFFICFGSVIFANTPFNSIRASDCGFTNLLPATTFTRVAGRYLFGVIMCLLGVTMGVISWLISNCFVKVDSKLLGQTVLIVLAGTLIALAIQYIMFYIRGNKAVNQWLVFLPFLPGLLFFAFGTSLLQWMNEVENFGVHMAILAGLNGAAVIILAAAMAISYQICKRRDFS